MIWALINGTLCTDIIVADAEFIENCRTYLIAEQILPCPEGFGIGDFYENGLWRKGDTDGLEA